METFEQYVIKIKEELVKRQSGSKKSIYNQKLQQFLMDWFKFRKISSLLEDDKEYLTEIQTYFDQYDITVYSKKHPSDSIKIDELSLYDPIAVRLKYIDSEVKNSGIIQVVEGVGKYSPYQFQQEAIESLANEISHKKHYSGIVVLPTGGGKTFTAVYWLLQNVINDGVKVLWIAHRHTLLDQALKTIRNNAYSKDANGIPLLTKRKEIRYRLISGLHGKAKSCLHTDDIIIANKDSLSNGLKKRNAKVHPASDSGLLYIYDNWLKKQTPKEVFIVIDEAHHAVAKSYRFVIEFLLDKGVSVRVLGLTATPTRISVKEQGLLSKVFPDNITYSISINNLLDQGFLAYPHILDEVKTGVDMTQVLTAKEIEAAKANDLDSISKKTAEELGDSPERNHLILNHYLQNKEKYGQTIVFAVNVQNAIALSGLFNSHQIKSDYILSGRFDQKQTVSSAELNQEKIERFKKGEITVLVNYNILTEGLDIPKIQTIFLTRPTISSVLMTQMVGRGLRGEKVGGTKETFIVPFVDEWHGLISWLSPKELLKSDIDFPDSKASLNLHIQKAISTNTIEQLTLLQNYSIDPEIKDLLESWEFIERIPVGLYIIEVDKLDNGGSGINIPLERESNILIYNHLQKAYADFIQQLPSLLEGREESTENPTENELDDLIDHIESTFFTGLKLNIGYSHEDIKDIILYYVITGELPEFLPFEERQNYDIDKIAKEFYKKGLGGKKKSEETNKGEETNKVWNDSKKGWQTFLGVNGFTLFKSQLDLALNKLEHPEHYKPSQSNPTVTVENRDYEIMPLEELKQHDPPYFQFLRNEVFKKHRNRTGSYFVKSPYFAHEKKIYFQLAYIVPLSEGGRTVLSNLRLKKKEMNWTITL
jgi:ATP-dependent helicase IRC3